MAVAIDLKLPVAVVELFSGEVVEQLVGLRRALHADPELSEREERTGQRLYDALAALKPKEISRVAGTGVVARIAGRDAGAPVVAVRGDIDALPIQEATGLPFASQNAGVMHACGHDVHATWAVGAAYLLSERPARGDVIVVLQPAEEFGTGALAVLESGALDDAVAIFGAHVDRRFAVGEVVAQAGPLAASTDNFEITLRGAGAHGARPHEARDPVVGLGALIGALQTVVARRVNPADPAVVTVGLARAGSAPNVIPDDAFAAGTLRSLEPATRAQLREEVEGIARGVAHGYGLDAEVRFLHGTPPIVNPVEPAGWARTAIERVLGAAAVVPLPTLNLGGEDFAFYLERMPGCFLRIGAREDGGEVIPAHTPRFYAAEESVFVGAAVLAETARVAGEEANLE